MYLKTLAVLGGGDQLIAVSAVAERLGVSPVTANEMLGRLIGEGLVEHEQRRGFRLTAQGRETAWNVIRRERLWERFLVDKLGLDEANVLAWACSLEHATAPEVLDALDAFLGFPTTCPQGQPIPRSPHDPVHCQARSLADVDVGKPVRLIAFDDTDPEIVTYLRRVGLAIGMVVRVADVGPRKSLMSLETPSGMVALGRELAAAIQTAALTASEELVP
jgi:DtxR family Mn-dependent transcriptional regulator